MTTPDIIQQLVQRFEEHKETYRSGKYNETQLGCENEGIDSLDYELYWLNEEEFGIVEGK